MRIRKTDLAESDLINIYRFGCDKFGILQSVEYISAMFDVFELLAQNPFIQRERHEYSQPIRLHLFQAHVIVYKTEDDALVILRILHGKQNWLEHL